MLCYSYCTPQIGFFCHITRSNRKIPGIFRRGGSAIKSDISDNIRQIRKKAAGTVLLILLAVMAFACTASAEESSLADSAQNLSGGTWVKNTKGKKYKKADGEFAQDAWIMVSGKVYRAGSDKYVKKGWFTVEDVKYYADSSQLSAF